MSRATAFGRWRAADVRSILAAGAGTPQPAPAGDALILQLPVVPTRSLADYALHPPVAEPVAGPQTQTQTQTQTEAETEASSTATGIGS